MKKDDPFDRLLERAVSLEGSARPAGACLDAETVAAWADGSLTEPARAAVELHTADCERCLAMVAAFAKTAPPPVEVQRSTWFSLRWLVPVTTAIVVVGVWALLQTRPEESRQVAPNAPPAIDAIATAPATSPPPQQERGSAAQTRPAPASEAKNAAPTLAARSRQAAGGPRRDEAREKNELQKRLPDGVITQSQTTTASATPAVVAPPNVPQPPAAASPPAVAPPLPSQREAVSNPAPFVSAAAGRGGGGAVGGIRAPLVIQSPDPNVRWRLASPPMNITIDGVSVSSIERSTDAGRTWTPQEPGVAGNMLLAGASPAPNVCWLVGRQGAVLLTTDGTSWRRIEFPEPKVDLVAVTARDALSAAVTTADRRVYQTDDGGKTWRLQEIPPAAF